MKRAPMILCTAMLVCIVAAAIAQVSDTASLNYNNPATVKDTHNESPATKDNSEQDKSQVGASSGVREGVISSEDQAQQLPKPTEGQTDQDVSTGQPAASDAGIAAGAGAGDKRVLKKGNSYYKDQPGKKGKRKRTNEKDKAKDPLNR